MGWNLPVFVCKIWVVKLNKFRTTAVECKSWKACRRWCDIGVLGHICVLEFFFYIKRLIKWGVLVVSLVLFTRQHVLIQGEVALFSSESAIVEVPGQTEEHWSHFSPLWVLQLSSPKCPRLQMDHWVKRGCLCETQFGHICESMIYECVLNCAFVLRNLFVYSSVCLSSTHDHM